MYGGGPAQQYAQLENMAKEAGLHVGECPAPLTLLSCTPGAPPAQSYAVWLTDVRARVH